MATSGSRLIETTLRRILPQRSDPKPDRLQLFQYWDQDPPADVLGWMETIRTQQTGFDYVRHDHASADAFIAAEYGGIVHRAWRSLLVPAMQADLLRLLLLYRHGGIYSDAAYELAADLPALLDNIGTGLMPRFYWLLNNGFMIVKRPGDIFIKACIDLVVDNIMHQRSRSALMVTGPGAINAMRAHISEHDRDAIDGLARCNAEWVEWGWDACREAASAIVAVTPDLIVAHAAFTAIPVISLERWARACYSSHRADRPYWYNWPGEVFRSEPGSGAPTASVAS